MAYTFNGIGTTYYGNLMTKGADGSTTTTNFFVFVMIPILPLSSWRVRPIGKETGFITRTQNYETIPMPMSWKQVLNVYAVAGATAAAAIIALYVFGKPR